MVSTLAKRRAAAEFTVFFPKQFTKPELSSRETEHNVCTWKQTRNALIVAIKRACTNGGALDPLAQAGNKESVVKSKAPGTRSRFLQVNTHSTSFSEIWNTQNILSMHFCTAPISTSSQIFENSDILFDKRLPTICQHLPTVMNNDNICQILSAQTRSLEGKREQ